MKELIHYEFSYSNKAKKKANFTAAIPSAVRIIQTNRYPKL